MTKRLHGFLRNVDRPDARVYGYDDITMLDPWPMGTVEFLVARGMLVEIELSDMVCLWECVDMPSVEPLWSVDPETGKLRGVAWCQHEECGIQRIDPERRRQWQTSCEGTLRAIRRLLGLEGDPIVDVPDRVWWLGHLKHEGRWREVFLVRGASRADAAKVIPQARRLAASANATVLCLRNLPPMDPRPRNWRTVLSLEQLMSVEKGELVLPVERLFEVQDRPEEESAEPMLTEQDVDVLEALNERPTQPLMVVELMEAAGYSKQVIRESIDRLMDQGLVRRPAGTSRKGVAIAEKGIAFLAQNAST